MSTQPELDPHHVQLVDAAVKSTLFNLGIDVSSPEAILEVRKDFTHLRDWRTSVQTMKSKSGLVVIGTFVTGTIGLFLLGAQALLYNWTHTGGASN